MIYYSLKYLNHSKVVVSPRLSAASAKLGSLPENLSFKIVLKNVYICATNVSMDNVSA